MAILLGLGIIIAILMIGGGWGYYEDFLSPHQLDKEAERHCYLEDDYDF